MTLEDYKYNAIVRALIGCYLDFVVWTLLNISNFHTDGLFLNFIKHLIWHILNSTLSNICMLIL